MKRSVAVEPVEGPAPWPEEQCNLVDAAIGAVTSSDLIDLTVLDIGPAVYATNVAEIDMLIEKSGQTTGHVQGVVVDVDYAAAYQTPFGPNDWQTVGYCDLIRFEPQEGGSVVSMYGDSGSLVFTPDPESVINPAVGRHFAGGDDGSYGVACKIQNVFAELQVDVLCSGGFQAFLDALAEDGADPEALLAASLFDRTQARPPRTMRFHTGLARDVERELERSDGGRQLVAVLGQHRAEVLSLLMTNGDVRRSVIRALRPIVRGAVTSGRVLDHVLTRADLQRVALALDVATRHASTALAEAIQSQRPRLEGRDNQTVRAVIDR